MSLLSRAQDFLNRVTSSAAATGVNVLYTRGAVTIPLVVTPTTPDADTHTQPTPVGKNADKERFYYVVAADLVAGGLGEPQDGDRITEVLNGVPCVFEVGPRRDVQAELWTTQRGRVRVRCIPRKLA